MKTKSILIHSNKKNGAMVGICAICFTLLSGILTGCSAAEDISSGVQAQTGFETANPDTQTEELQNILAITDAESGQETLNPDTDRDESSEAALSADSEEIKKVVEQFAVAYFSGDVSAVKSLLPDSYAWDIEVYEDTGKISEIMVKDLPDAEELELGSVWTVSVQYRDSAHEDMFQYLTCELVKQSAGWEIQFYGLEG